MATPDLASAVVSSAEPWRWTCGKEKTVSDKTVKGAKYGTMYGWARIDHEAQVVEKCVRLGAVLLSPAAHQSALTSFATDHKERQTAGFAK